MAGSQRVGRWDGSTKPMNAMEPPTRTQTACPNAYGKKGDGDSQQASASDQHHRLGKNKQQISAEELEKQSSSKKNGLYIRMLNPSQDAMVAFERRLKLG